MNYNNGGQYGAPRRRSPQAMHYGRAPFETLHSRSDFSPSEHNKDIPTLSNQQHHEHSHTTWGLSNHPLAMVYAPLQAFSGLYDEDTALSRGTLFSALDLPFEAHKCNGKDRCC